MKLSKKRDKSTPCVLVRHFTQPLKPFWDYYKSRYPIAKIEDANSSNAAHPNPFQQPVNLTSPLSCGADHTLSLFSRQACLRQHKPHLMTHRHLICELHPYSRPPTPFPSMKKEKKNREKKVRTWLRIVSILQVLTKPTSFPVVLLARPFGTRAVLQT